MRRVAGLLIAAALALAALPARAAFEVNGVGLGASEADVKKRYPSAYCKPLEWKSRGANRRCDDARIALAGIEARVTFYLLDDAVQGYDLRFASTELDRVRKYLAGQWGKPGTERTELIQRKEKKPREVYKARWAQGEDHALLSAQLEKKRAWLSVSRGRFDEEIYRVR